MTKLFNPIKEIMVFILQKISTLIDRSDYVCYYPVFDTKEDLINHYFRALWYLPWHPSFCTKVTFWTSFQCQKPTDDNRPSYMIKAPSIDDHITVSYNSLGYIWMLLRARNIVIWKIKHDQTFLARLLGKILGKRISYVAIEDVEGREYATYCELLWWMLSDQKKNEIIQENRSRHNAYAQYITGLNLKEAYVFGNGPSLECAYDFDFSNGLRVMCNSVVSNVQLLNHVRPHYLIAGDPLSHFGVSTYAGKYRKDLFQVLKTRDLRLLVPEFQGFILLANYPEYAEKIILVPLHTRVPNYDMIKYYRMPLFWSVLNAGMLPLASTFVDEIYLLGCDGKSQSRSNEDFWAHAKGVQYDDLVTAGHQCHPTFDIHRQSHPEYVRVQIDLTQTILYGEELHGKKYRTLKPSHMALLDTRLAELDEIKMILIEKELCT